MRYQPVDSALLYSRDKCVPHQRVSVHYRHDKLSMSIAWIANVVAKPSPVLELTCAMLSVWRYTL